MVQNAQFHKLRTTLWLEVSYICILLWTDLELQKFADCTCSILKLCRTFFKPRRLTNCTQDTYILRTMQLTERSLNGCSSKPNGSRHLLSKDCVDGMVFNVLHMILSAQTATDKLQYAKHMQKFIYLLRQNLSIPSDHLKWYQTLNSLVHFVLQDAKTYRVPTQFQK